MSRTRKSSDSARLSTRRAATRRTQGRHRRDPVCPGQRRHACILPGVLVRRARPAVTASSVSSTPVGIPFATMFADKSVLDEQQPSYIGMYDGRLMNPDVRAVRRVLRSGRDRRHAHDRLQHRRVHRPTGPDQDDPRQASLRPRSAVASSLTSRWAMSSLALTRRAPARVLTLPVRAGTLGSPSAKTTSPHRRRAVPAVGAIPQAGRHRRSPRPGRPRWDWRSRSFRRAPPSTTRPYGARSAGLPRPRSAPPSPLRTAGWCWSPAKARISSRCRRSAQIGRPGLKPMIFVLNNSGYLIERLLCSDPNIAYNDVAQWNYTEAPARTRLRRLVHGPGDHLR